MIPRSIATTLSTCLVLCVCACCAPPSAVLGEPGDLITIQARCVYKPDAESEPVTETSSTAMVVLSPLALDRPVYLAQGWGSTNKLANGIKVRAFVWIDGLVTLGEGIQLSDGRVWIKGQACQRAEVTPQMPLFALPGFAPLAAGNNLPIAGEHNALKPLSHPEAGERVLP